MNERYNRVPSSIGDPSDRSQFFPKLDLQVLCCRFWWLKHWEHYSLEHPIWRLYYNFQKGAQIISGDLTYELEPDKLYLIAPDTVFSTSLYHYHIPKEHVYLEAGRIGDESESSRYKLLKEKALEHLFIHFRVGYPFDHAKKGVYVLPLSDNDWKRIHDLRLFLLQPIQTSNLKFLLQLRSFIYEQLSQLEEEVWESSGKDERILKVYSFVFEHLEQNLSNAVLADAIAMSENAFSRLFKQETGLSPQKYVKRQRINKASALLLQSEKSIDQIAEMTGFSNRYHFSRVFHELINVSPAKYRKEKLQGQRLVL